MTQLRDCGGITEKKLDWLGKETQAANTMGVQSQEGKHLGWEEGKGSVGGGGYEECDVWTEINGFGAKGAY